MKTATDTRRPFASLTTVCLACLLSLSAVSDTFRWNAVGGGDWDAPSNWTLIDGTSGRTYPNHQTDVAQFYGSIAADSLINVNGTYTVKDIRFDQTSHTYTIGGGGQLNGPPETAGTHMHIYLDNSSLHEIVATLAAPRYRSIRAYPSSGATLVLSNDMIRATTGGNDPSFSVPGGSGGSLIYQASATGYGGVGITSNARFGIGVDGAFGTTTSGNPILLSMAGGNAVAFAHGADRSLDGGVYVNNSGVFDTGNGFNLTFAGNSFLGVTGASGNNAWAHWTRFIGPGVVTFDGPVTFSHTQTLTTPNVGTPGKVVFNAANNATMTNGVDPRQVRLQNAITVGIGSDLAFGIGNLQLQSSGPVFMAEGGARSIANPINLQSHTLTVAGANDLNLAGIVSGASGKLVKTGSGSLTLTGDNTYGGGTTINEGALVAGVDDALGSGPVTVNGGILSMLAGVSVLNPVTFNLGSTLAGAGTLGVAGDLVAPDDFTLAPGTSTGTLTLDLGGDTLFMTGTTTSEIEIAEWDDFDSLHIMGGAQLDGNLSITLLDGYLPAYGTTFDVITTTAGLTGAVNLTGPDGMWFASAIDGTTLRLTSLIPEPTSGLLLALAGLAACRRRQANR